MPNPATPFNNIEPSLAVTIVVPTEGIFPSTGDGGTLGGGGVGSGETLGFIYDFAGNFVPSGSIAASGQSLASSGSALFHVLGNTYGGAGTSDFNVPNLNGNAIIGTGAGQTLGILTGSSTVTLIASQIPAQGSGAGRAGLPFSNLQPSLPIQTLICVSGTFPLRDGPDGTSAFIGEIANFAGTFVPAGWALANGQAVAINGNTALFSILGTSYGGNGVTFFDLPNLQGAVAVGANAAHPVGTLYGQASTTLTTAQLPPGGQPVTNDQPSLAIEYLVATSGIFPSMEGSSSFDPTTETLGQIVEFAGNFVPSGYMLADGALLSIAENTSLFDLLGTIYGGDGITNFALPDFRGRTAIGADGANSLIGHVYGTDSTLLTAANIPACYLAGTLIKTATGEIAIEHLAIGDMLPTESGEMGAIRWIGRRSYDGRFLAANPGVHPVRFQAGCLGDGLPRRDLFVSPKHAMFLDGVLVPAETLVNGGSIRFERSLTSVAYLHVELAHHAVIFAEGAPSESFLDDDSRQVFHNAATFAELYPDAEPGWFCAPRVDWGYRLQAIRDRIRAVPLPVAA